MYYSYYYLPWDRHWSASSLMEQRCVKMSPISFILFDDVSGMVDGLAVRVLGRELKCCSNAALQVHKSYDHWNGYWWGHLPIRVLGDQLLKVILTSADAYSVLVIIIVCCCALLCAVMWSYVLSAAYVGRWLLKWNLSYVRPEVKGRSKPDSSYRCTKKVTKTYVAVVDLCTEPEKRQDMVCHFRQ